MVYRKASQSARTHTSVNTDIDGLQPQKTTLGFTFVKNQEEPEATVETGQVMIGKTSYGVFFLLVVPSFGEQNA